MVIKKFGGTSVQNAERINALIDIVKDENESTLIVVSAMGHVTDTLVSICDNLKHYDRIFAINDLKQISKVHTDLIEELDLGEDAKSFFNSNINKIKLIIDSVSNEIPFSPASADIIMAMGELFSSKLIHYALKNKGVENEFIDSRSVIRTNSNHMDAEVDLFVTEKEVLKQVKPIFEKQTIAIMGGFIGSDMNNETTTIGRGGSDYTASIAANILGASKLEIWTDVDGIMTVDPRINSKAKRIIKLSYDEAAELAYFGANVLHPKTLGPAISKEIPVLVKNSFQVNAKGTLIENIEDNPKIIKALSYWDDITIINIKSNRMLGAYGFLSKVFEVFKKFETSVDLIATSEVSLSITIDNIKNLTQIITELEKFSNVSVSFNHAIISAIGDGIRQTSGIGARFFGVLSDINIKMVSIGASEVNMSVVINEGDLSEALNRLHNEFFEGQLPSEIFEN